MSNILDEEGMGEESGLSANAFQNLQKIGTWTRITAICGIIMGGLIMVFLLYFAVILMGNSRVFAEIGAVVILVGVVVLVFGGFLMYLMLQISKNTTQFVQTRNAKDYAVATDKRKIYWIIAGVLSILSALSGLLQIFQLLGR